MLRRTAIMVLLGAPIPKALLKRDDDGFLEDLSVRSFQFFWEHADPATGLILDRSRTDGEGARPAARGARAGGCGGERGEPRRDRFGPQGPANRGGGGVDWEPTQIQARGRIG